MLRPLPLLALLVGCASAGPGQGGPPLLGEDDDLPAGGLDCPGTPGEAAAHLLAADGSALQPAGELAVHRQYQGAVASLLTVALDGVEGGTLLEGFAVEIRSQGGDLLAERRFDEAPALCEGEAVRWSELEVFFAYGGPFPEVDGLEAELSLRATLPDGTTISDGGTCVLRADP